MKKRAKTYASPAKTRKIPSDTVRRLSFYLRSLKYFKERGLNKASSKEIAALFDISPVQFRKDMSYFGKFGRSGLGYNVDFLSAGIKKIIGTDKICNVALIGTGELASALLNHPELKEFNFNICGAFDDSFVKTAKTCGGIKIRPLAELKSAAGKMNIKVAILAVKKEAAQETARFLVQCGIKAVLNLTSAAIVLPDKMPVSNLDITGELETLACRLRRGA